MTKYTKKGYSWIVTDDYKEFVDIRCLYSNIQNDKCKQNISRVNLDMVLYDNTYPILVDDATIYASTNIDEITLQKLLLELLKAYLSPNIFQYDGNSFLISTSDGNIKGHIYLDSIVIDDISIKDMMTVGNIFKVIVNSKFKIKTNLCGRMIA